MSKQDLYSTPQQRTAVANNDTEPTAEVKLKSVENWYHDNSKMINNIAIGIVALAVGIFAYNQFWKTPNNKKANDAIYRAQTYFGIDSINWALNGEGNTMGFKKIADKYSSTPAGNLANYYSGICYLKMGDYKNAEKYLKEFDGKGTMVANVAKGALGDALMEQGKTDEAIKAYIEASADEENILISPIYLERAGIAYEMKNNTAEAIKMYRKLKETFPQSQQAQTIGKNLARLGDLNP